MDLEKIIELCKKHRVSQFKNSEFEFTLELPPSDEALAASREIAAIMEKQASITDDEILFNPMAGLDGGNGYANNKYT